MSTAGYGSMGGGREAFQKALDKKLAEEEKLRQASKPHQPKKEIKEKAPFAGLTSRKKSGAPQPKLPKEVLPEDAPVVNKEPTDPKDLEREELEALPDNDLHERAMKLPNFDESWSRKDFIRELLK